MPEQKTCPVTGQQFTITDEELAFLDDKAAITIGSKRFTIPPPTLSPLARAQRRLAFRNQQTLYKRPCAKSGKPIISIYSPDKPHVVYSPEEWWGDSWNGLDYARDYDFNRPFFDQFKDLMEVVPHIGVLRVNEQNSDFTNQTYDCKDCYLSSAIKDCDGALYCQNANKLTDCLESSFCFGSELLYECSDCHDCYSSFFALRCINCSDCIGCYDCIGSKNCIGSTGLRNQQYVYFGEQLNQADYEAKKVALNLHTDSGKAAFLQQWSDVLTATPKEPWLRQCEGCTGDNVVSSRGAINCFDSQNLEDCRNCSWIFDSKDCGDCYGMGESQVIYECLGVEEVQQVAFSFGTSMSSECYYTDLCMNCNRCFGCVGLRNQSYCVFNKQLQKEEYEDLVPRIIEQMSGPHLRSSGASDGQAGPGTGPEWGEFFPMQVSAFCYNESKAQEMYPLTKEQAQKWGLSWKDDIDQPQNVEKVIPSSQLPDAIDDIPDDLLNWAVECEETKRPYRIAKKELQFYRTQRLPVPKKHPDMRMKERLASR